MAFDRGDRTYYVSDDRLHAFRALSVEEKLRWVEELATFLRLARPAGSPETRRAEQTKPADSDPV